MVTCDSILVHVESIYPRVPTRRHVAEAFNRLASIEFPSADLGQRMQMDVNIFRPRYAQFLTTTIMLGVVFLSLVLAGAEALRDQSRFCRRNFGLYAQSSLSEGCKSTFTCEEIARSISPKSQVFYPGEIRVVGSWWVPP